MGTYIKLVRIRYNNKLFDVYSDKNHRRAFLEVKIENGVQVNYYPQFSDYIYLNGIYNKRFDGILYSKKYNFVEKVLLKNGMAIGISGLVAAYAIVGCAFIKDLHKYETIDTPISYEQTAGNFDDDYFTQINSLDEFDELGIEQVQFADVRETLRNNQNIVDADKEIINEFIDALEERLPDVDLRTFNMNLKTLKIDRCQNINDMTGGYYNVNNNTLTLLDSDNYGGFKSEKLVFFHELCHTLNNTIYEYVDSDGIINSVFKGFQLEKNCYGDAFDESINTVLTDYLMTKDWENYFDQPSHFYISYQTPAKIAYQILKNLDNYSFYDYLDGNVLSFEKAVNDRFDNMDDIIDALDSYVQSSRENEYVDVESLDSIEDDIFRKIVLGLCNGNVSDYNIYDIVKNIDLCDGRKYDICEDLLTEYNGKWLVKVDGVSEAYNNPSYDKINFYKDNELVLSDYSREIDICCTEDGSIHFGHKVYFDDTHYKWVDVITNEDIKPSQRIDCHDTINEVFNLPEAHNIGIDIDLLNQKEFQDYIKTQFNLGSQDSQEISNSK